MGRWGRAGVEGREIGEERLVAWPWPCLWAVDRGFRGRAFGGGLESFGGYLAGAGAGSAPAVGVRWSERGLSEGDPGGEPCRVVGVSGGQEATADPVEGGGVLVAGGEVGGWSWPGLVGEGVGERVHGSVSTGPGYWPSM